MNKAENHHFLEVQDDFELYSDLFQMKLDEF
jgi:hypothetical protein